MAEQLGHIESQLVTGPIKKVSVECQGTADEIRPLSLALLKGLLEPHVPDRINYINAETIAKELGLEIDIHYSNKESNYLNLISVRVTADDIAYRLDGSVFDNQHLRLVNILGREMEVTPKGPMLFVENNDVPGVIGKVGTLLGNLNINIAAYLLNRGGDNGKAFAVIRLDNPLDEDSLNTLAGINELESVNQIHVSN